MTSLALKQIIAEALAEIGVDTRFLNIPDKKLRTTTWFEHERGFGNRHYAPGREVYVAQTRMGGRVRIVTIAPCFERMIA